MRATLKFIIAASTIISVVATTILLLSYVTSIANMVSGLGQKVLKKKFLTLKN